MLTQSQIDEYEALATPLQYKPNIYNKVKPSFFTIPLDVTNCHEADLAFGRGLPQNET